MNIKKVLLVTVTTSLFATTLLSTNYVNAEDWSEYEPEAETSEAKVTFKLPESYDAVDSLNPRDPDADIIDEDLGKPTGQNGPLTLDVVSDIDFGTQTVDFEGGQYESETELPYVQVTDLRGPGKGWNVTAQASEFTNDGDPSLYGAAIHLNDGEAVKKSSNGTSLDENAVNKEIELDAGAAAVKVVSTNGGTMQEPEGLGSWIIRWLDDDFDLENENKNEKVILDIPQASATAGDHLSTITWTLTDGPGN